MSRAIKELIVQDYEKRFRDVSDLAVVSAQGLDVGRMTALRRSLREKGFRAMIVKNRLCRRAFEAVGLEAAVGLLRGPSTLVWGGEGIVEIAKTLVQEARTLTELQIRGGYSAGQVLSGDQIDTLSKLPSREELIGQVIGRAIGQAARVVALAMSPSRRVAAQVREVEKRAPASEGTEQPAEAKAEGGKAGNETDKAGGTEPHASPGAPGPAQGKDPENQQEPGKA
ncbi:MAG: 50S ribosomal protein L10 [Phycisphaerae bacterium]|nr:50S ribosomal protein L10 [Phycisphaerae bacterium]